MKSIFMNNFSECLQLFENIENIDQIKIWIDNSLN